MATDYYTLDALKSDLSLVASGNNQRASAAITAASRQIDEWCGRRFWPDLTVVVREVYADSCDVIRLLDQGPEIASTSGLIVKVDDGDDGTFETTLTIGTDFILLPRNAAADGVAFSEVVRINNAWPRYTHRAGIQITALWGWPSIPDAVTSACGLQAALIYKSTDAPLGFVGYGQDGEMAVRSTALHGTAKGLLAPYRRPPLA